MNTEAAAPRRRLKLKAPEGAPAAAAAPQAAQRAPKAPRAAPKPKDDAKLADRVHKAVTAPHKPQTAGQASGIEVATRLAQRHHEWLCRVAAKEGRDLGSALERIVRVAYAADPTKGYAAPEPGSGVAVAGAAAGGNGLTGAHPARGGAG